jgi:LemA protein
MEWLLLIVTILALFAVVRIYNGLVRSRNTVNEAWAGIDVQLQKRHELVPNLVATVKGYAAHESGVQRPPFRVPWENFSHWQKTIRI